jgi:hypothetical protein
VKGVKNQEEGEVERWLTKEEEGQQQGRLGVQWIKGGAPISLFGKLVASTTETFCFVLRVYGIR